MAFVFIFDRSIPTVNTAKTRSPTDLKKRIVAGMENKAFNG